MNWSLCCLCHTDAGGEIRCPAQSKCRDKGAGYESLSNAFSQIESSHSLQMDILEFLSNDADHQQTLIVNQSTFHKSCLNKQSQAKGKRPYEAIEGPVHASPAKTRKLSQYSTSCGECLFCGVSDSEDVLMQP